MAGLVVGYSEGNIFNDSVVERKNILNNDFAVAEIEKEVSIPNLRIDGQYYITTQQVASYFGVSLRTIQRLIESNTDELKSNGYRVATGSELKSARDVYDIDVVNILKSKAPKQGLFSFRAFLNVAMLLTDSLKARELRQKMLDIAVNTVNKIAGGDTKYINQRDEKFLLASFYNESYNKKLKQALKNHVTNSQDKSKYANYNDKVYQIIFLENAQKYKKMLELTKKENARDTMYAEVLSAISSFENTIASTIETRATELKRPLTRQEVDEIFEESAKHPAFEPQIELARRNMASFDNALRNKQHEALSEYISPITQADFERFLGEKSKALSDRINDNLEMFKRLKDQ